MAAAYDSYLPWFIKPLPRSRAWANLPADSETKDALAGRLPCCRGGTCAGASIQWRLRWRSSGARRSPRRANTRATKDEFAAPVRAGRCGSEGAGDRLRQADCGFWQLADAVGKDQSLSAPDRRYCAALRRCAAEHAGRVHLVHLGLAGCVRRQALHRGGNRPGQGRRSGTEPAATALSRWWSLGIRCAPGR
jgi:hypothetical protein